jgi:hypothetical protein
MAALTPQQTLAGDLKKFFEKREIDSRSMYRGAGNLIKMMAVLNALPDNILNIVGSNNIPKNLQRRQLIVLRPCKCSIRKRHFDMAYIQSVQPGDEIFSKFILLFLSRKQVFATVTFCFM